MQVPRSSRATFGIQYSLAFGVINPDLPIHRLGGFLFTSADIVLPVPSGPYRTTATMSFPIPNSAQLLGVKFHQQVLGAYVGASPLPSHLSRGGVGVIGR